MSDELRAAHRRQEDLESQLNTLSEMWNVCYGDRNALRARVATLEAEKASLVADCNAWTERIAELRVRQEYMLRNAHRLLRRARRANLTVLWTLVSEVTGHGCTVSHEICQQLGWNPNAPISSDLPPSRAA